MIEKSMNEIVFELREKGLSYQKIANKLLDFGYKVSHTTVMKILRGNDKVSNEKLFESVKIESDPDMTEYDKLIEIYNREISKIHTKAINDQNYNLANVKSLQAIINNHTDYIYQRKLKKRDFEEKLFPL